MKRRNFIKGIGAIFALSLIPKVYANESLPENLDKERLELMAHIKKQFQEYPVRYLYRKAKSRFKFPARFQDYVDSLFKKAEPKEGFELIEDIYKQLNEGGESLSGYLFGNVWIPADQNKRKQIIREHEKIKPQLVELVDDCMEHLSSLVPPEKRQEDQPYREKLREFRERFVKKELKIDMDRLREHVDKYEQEDLAIIYANMRNPIEAVQFFLNEPFSLYVQMAFGKKGKIFWPTVDEKGKFASIEEALQNPAYTDLAIVGHGSWDSVGLGGIAENPEDFIIKAIKSYNKNPKKTSEILFSSHKANPFGLFNNKTGLEELGVKIAGSSLVERGTEIKEGFWAFQGIGKSIPVSKKPGKLVKYTCGTGRLIRGNHREYRGTLNIDTLKQRLEYKLDILKKAEELENKGIKRTVKYKGSSIFYNNRYYEENDEGYEIKYKGGPWVSGPLNIKRRIKWVESDLGRLADGDVLGYLGVKERPLFGTSIMQNPENIHAYEGVVWLSDYLREPFPKINKRRIIKR